MKNKLRVVIGICLCLLIAVSFGVAGAQKRTVTKGKHVSAADRKAIMALFKGVDKKKYRLEFATGRARTAQGSKKVSMKDVRQVRKYVSPGEAAGWIVLVVETSSGGDHVIYVVAVGGKELNSVIGEEKAAKLQQIMAKYGR